MIEGHERMNNERPSQLLHFNKRTSEDECKCSKYKSLLHGILKKNKFNSQHHEPEAKSR